MRGGIGFVNAPLTASEVRTFKKEIKSLLEDPMGIANCQKRDNSLLLSKTEMFILQQKQKEKGSLKIKMMEKTQERGDKTPEQPHSCPKQGAVRCRGESQLS